MPKGYSNFRPLDEHGEKMLTVREFCDLTGFSTNHIRERCTAGRGEFIPNTKIGNRIFISRQDGLAAIYNSRKRVDPSCIQKKHKEPEIVVPDWI